MGVEMNFRLNSKLKSHPKQNLQKSLEREYEVFCKMVVVHSLFIDSMYSVDNKRLWNYLLLLYILLTFLIQKKFVGTACTFLHVIAICFSLIKN